MISRRSKAATWIFSHFITILFLGATRLMIYAQPITFEMNTIPLKGDLINFSGTCFLQDSDAFMWFGSNDGLYRYHGTGMKIYRNIPYDSNYLSNNMIKVLFEDSDGVIWIGTE